MSEVIIIDDDEYQPAISKQRKRRKPAQQQQQQQYVDLVSDDEEYEPTPQPKRKKKATKPAHDLEDNISPAEAKPKKQRQPRKAKEPVEKRTNEYGATVRYAAQPSQAVYQRIQRALPGSGHRMFLISTKELAPAGAPDGRAQEFVVLGATGNVYNVRISRHPHCNCPDHAKGNLCKHILFVMLRVLKLSTNNPLVWQKALLTKEVEEILSGQHSQGVDAGVVAEEGVLRAYRAATGEAAADGAAAAGSSVNKRKSVEGDCPICFNELKEGAEPLVWCKSSCGNNMHKVCFDQWAKSKRNQGQQVTCVYCRAVWASDEKAGGASQGAGDYLNLAQHSHQYNSGISLQELYGDTAVWIQHHQGGYGGRGGTARMWRSGFGSGAGRRR